MRRHALMTLLCWALLYDTAGAQQGIPVEVMIGNRRSSADVLWFRNFTNAKGNTTPWLFFHRSRALVDHSNRTSFAMTNAVSRNFSNGLGIVLATQFLRNGFTAKAGVQYFRPFTNGSLFTWLVAGNNTSNNFSADHFVLARWTPPLTRLTRWYLQLESFISLDDRQNKNLTQRLRAGISRNKWQYGLATDQERSGNASLDLMEHYGIFIRKEL